ncbi:MAG: phage terminase small subunit P27 family [Clostridiales bacterium]|nr:phage terminase small subunit P27 family [Clostridiales bacterium]
MARPAKSAGLRTGHMTKSEIEQRNIAETAIRGTADKLSPPEYLTANQADVFSFIVDTLRDSAILSNLDVYVLTNCAVTIDRIRQYDEMISSNAELLYDKDIISNRNKLVTEFLRYCNELCLSPQARAKIGTAAVAKSKAETNPEEKLLQELTKNAG